MKKDIDVLVVGSLHANIYPIRAKVSQLISSGKVPGKVFKHPGYRGKFGIISRIIFVLILINLLHFSRFE